jgi:hypothetical protein
MTASLGPADDFISARTYLPAPKIDETELELKFLRVPPVE